MTEKTCRSVMDVHTSCHCQIADQCTVRAVQLPGRQLDPYGRDSTQTADRGCHQLSALDQVVMLCFSAQASADTLTIFAANYGLATQQHACVVFEMV